MRVFRAIAIGCVLACGAPWAQAQSGDMLTHYRAYNTAIERNDLAVAAQEAELALAAADAANDDHAGVLALNLALVRVWRNDFSAALAPAQRALALAEAGAPGVDRNMAALLLGRAELGTSGQAGADRLAALFSSADLSGTASDEIYPAAAQLGSWALSQRQLTQSESAWVMAEAHASGSPLGEQFGMATALIGQAIAIISSDLNDRSRRVDRANAEEAYALLNRARNTLLPLAERESPSLELTVPQLGLAQAMAWRGIVRSRLMSEGRNLSDNEGGDADDSEAIGPTDLSAPRCLTRIRIRSMSDLSRYYPSRALDGGEIASAVIRLTLDPSGEILNHDVVANVGSPSFVEAVRRIGAQMSVERRDESAPNCRMPRSMLRTVVFTLGLDA